MPNRYVRAGIIDSEPVNALSESAEVFYRRLINRVDDFGRFHANPALLRASLYPLKIDAITSDKIAALLKECEQVGLVFTYAHDGKRFLVMNKWEKGRAKSSDFPPPDDDTCSRMKTYVYTRKHMSAYAPDSDTVSDTDSLDSLPPSVEAERPSLREVQAHAATIGLAPWRAEDWFDEMEGCGWKDRQMRPVMKWRHVLSRVKSFWEADGRPMQRPSINGGKQNAHNGTAEKRIDRSIGTANEGIAAQYANLPPVA